MLPPFLPFIGVLDYLRELPLLEELLTLAYWFCVIGILLGWHFQKLAFVLGALVLYQILCSKIQYSTSFLFSGCLLILIGVYRRGFYWIFRWQIGILYIGAGLNKLLQEDWLSGLYFENFLLNIYPTDLGRALIRWVGLDLVSKLFSYATITAELLLGIWAFSGFRRFYLFSAILVFHLAILIFTYGQLSYIYFYLMATAAIMVLPWSANSLYPEKGGVLTYSRNSLASELSFKKILKFKNISHFSSHSSPKAFQTRNVSTINLFQIGYFSLIFLIVFVAKYKLQLIAFFK